MATIILARSKNKVIGKENWLPWSIPSDFKHFKETTMNSTVVMGRKTFESLNSKPLPHRNNIVLSSTINGSQDGVTYMTMNEFKNSTFDGDVYIIGGSQIYDYFMDHDLVSSAIITEVDAIVEGDSYFRHDDKLSKFRLSKGEVRQADGDQYQYTIDRYIRI